MHSRPPQLQHLHLLVAALASVTCASSCAAYGFQGRPHEVEGGFTTPTLAVHTISTSASRGADLRRATQTLVDAARRCGVDAQWGAGEATSATLACDATGITQSSTDEMTLARGELRCILTDARGDTTLVAGGTSTRGGLADDVFTAMIDAQTDALIDASRQAGCDAARALTQQTASRADHGQKTPE